MKTIVRKNGLGLVPELDWTSGFFDEALSAKTKSVPVNIMESATDYQIELAIPGYQKEQIDISLKKGKLVVNGESVTSKEEGVNYIKNEIVANGFSKSFVLPEDKIAEDEISASFENGILKVVIPKKEVVIPEEKKILIS